METGVIIIIGGIAVLIGALGVWLYTRKDDNENDLPQIQNSPEQQNQKQHKKNSLDWLYILIIITVLGSIYYFVILGGDPNTNTDPINQIIKISDTVTMAEYERVQIGMSYKQVKAIIGAPGEELSRTEIGGILAVMYMWQNKDSSNMNVMFQNDAVYSKAQFGLR